MKVLNEDFIEPKSGFPEHGHSDIEVISVIIKGKLVHIDSISKIKTECIAGSVSHISTGTGINHSEFGSDDETTHLIQVWLNPSLLNTQPKYQYKEFNWITSHTKCTLLASNTGENGSILYDTDVKIYGVVLVAGKKNQGIQFNCEESEGFYIHNTEASNSRLSIEVQQVGFNVDKQFLDTGDGAAIELNHKAKLSLNIIDSDLKNPKRGKIIAVAFSFSRKSPKWEDLSVQDKWTAFLNAQAVRQRSIVRDL